MLCVLNLWLIGTCWPTDYLLWSILWWTIQFEMYIFPNMGLLNTSVPWWSHLQTQTSNMKKHIGHHDVVLRSVREKRSYLQTQTGNTKKWIGHHDVVLWSVRGKRKSWSVYLQSAVLLKIYTDWAHCQYFLSGHWFEGLQGHIVEKNFHVLRLSS